MGNGKIGALKVIEILLVSLGAGCIAYGIIEIILENYLLSTIILMVSSIALWIAYGIRLYKKE